MEQFYFLATGWLSRSLKASSTLKGEDKIAAWCLKVHEELLADRVLAGFANHAP